MKLLICIMLIIFVIGTAASVQVGGPAGKALLLGSMTKGVSNQNETLNQTNATNQTSASIEINNSMRPVPAINKFKSVILPNNIEANSIVYQFTT
jgi:hypothetical protein